MLVGTVQQQPDDGPLIGKHAVIAHKHKSMFVKRDQHDVKSFTSIVLTNTKVCK